MSYFSAYQEVKRFKMLSGCATVLHEKDLKMSRQDTAFRRHGKLKQMVVELCLQLQSASALMIHFVMHCFFLMDVVGCIQEVESAKKLQCWIQGGTKLLLPWSVYGSF